MGKSDKKIGTRDRRNEMKEWTDDSEPSDPEPEWF
jgi:hypothetical protein